MNSNVIRDKSFSLAIDTIKICEVLNENKEFVLSKQLLRSGTSIGAQVRESKYAESKKDFIHKLKIGLKEAEECEYWILLLRDSRKIEQVLFKDYHFKLIEIIKILRKIIITSINNG